MLIEKVNIFKVMTYNLKYASPNPPNAWLQRRPVMVELIRQQAPDVIGTQEGLYQQLKDLASDLSEYAWIGLGRDGGSRGEFMAVFYRHDRLEPVEFDHFWLSDTPEAIGSTTWGNKTRRMATWVKFHDRQIDKPFYFFNTHFDNQVEVARQKSAELVTKRVHALQTELPVLLVGDFNDAAKASKTYDLLVNDDGFRDAWLEAEKRGEEVGTFHNYNGPKLGEPQIDWILMRGSMQTIMSQILTFSLDGQYPSDHFPVIAWLCHV